MQDTKIKTIKITFEKLMEKDFYINIKKYKGQKNIEHQSEMIDCPCGD